VVLPYRCVSRLKRERIHACRGKQLILVSAALYDCGLIQIYHASDDWALFISDLNLLGQLGLAYIVFSHIESSYCRWSGTQDAWLQNISVVLVLEGAFASSWGCKQIQSMDTSQRKS